MDTSLYISKIEEHLADPNTYKELNCDPTQAIRNNALSTLDYLHKTHQIDSETKYHLTSPNPAKTPPFYGPPKSTNRIYHLNQHFQHVTALPISFPHTSRTANTLYSSFTPSHLCLRITS